MVRRRTGGCVFCGIVAGDLPASMVYEDDRFAAFMDIYPWRPGHVLVIPRAHAERIGELGDDVPPALFGLGAQIAAAVRASAMPCDDVHFLINDGRAANQTVPHVHLHVLPRTQGDLWRLVRAAAQRPLVPLMKPAPRAELDRQAALIRAALP